MNDTEAIAGLRARVKLAPARYPCPRSCRAGAAQPPRRGWPARTPQDTGAARRAIYLPAACGSMIRSASPLGPISSARPSAALDQAIERRDHEQDQRVEREQDDHEADPWTRPSSDLLKPARHRDVLPRCSRLGGIGLRHRAVTRGRDHAELALETRELDPIHGTVAHDEVPQRSQPGLGEVGARSSRARPYLDEAARHHARCGAGSFG